MTITFSSMASAETDTITIVAQVGSTATGTVLDTATANWISGTGSASNNWSTVGMMIGTPSASIKPSSVNCGNVILHTKSAAKNITVTNNGTGSLVLYSIGTSGANNGDFSFSSIQVADYDCTQGEYRHPGVLNALGRRKPKWESLRNRQCKYQLIVSRPWWEWSDSHDHDVTSSANPSLLGQSVTFTSKVSCSASAGPTGTVTFKRLGAVLGLLR